MNNDLISREALKEALEVTQYNDIDDLTRTEKLIDNAPTVQEDKIIQCHSMESKSYLDGFRKGYEAGKHERPQGEWVFNTSFWICSVCKNSAKTIGYCGDKKFMNEFFRFCPNCGASMKGGKE